MFQYSSQTALRNVEERTAVSGANGGHCRAGRTAVSGANGGHCRAGIQQLAEQMADIAGLAYSC